MESLKEFKIQFTGLKEGTHHFNHRIKKTFFDALGNEDLVDADIICKVNLEKKSSMVVLNIEFDGIVKAECDRCTELCDVKVSAEPVLYYKFTEGSDSDDADVYFVSTSESVIDYSQPLYDYIILSLPARRVHEEGQCDLEIMNAINNIREDEDTSPDPRWDALKKLK